VPSSFTGTIKEIIAKEDETVSVGDLMCYIETEGANGENSNAEKNTEPAKPTESEQKGESESKDQSMKKRYSPAVLKLSQENDIDLDQVVGSGRGGRITRKDVEKIIESGEAPTSPASPGEPVNPAEQKTPSKQTSATELSGLKTSTHSQAGDTEIPVTGVRKAIAQNMVRSTTEIPHAWMMVEVDLTNLVTYRNSIKNDFKQKEGFSLTFFSFFVKAVAQALKEYPQLNSSWAGDKIIRHQDINLSIAVAKDTELFVPVIKNADEKNIKGIAKDIHSLAGKAREGKLSSTDMEGGTFTVNNTGSFGSVQSMGVINHPQAAILQVESIVKKPVIIDDMFAARHMVNLCLSLDHRILDGLVSGNFLARVKAILENMSSDNTSVY